MNNKVRKIEIDVANNDPVDIRCGGPLTLGFNFVVSSGVKQDWVNFFKKLGKEQEGRKGYEFWKCSISSPIIPRNRKWKIWTKKQIEEEVTNYEP